MKKKIKLISTFASLGLALALMVFGVYAATAVQFKVTTNVSFTETAHVKATVSAVQTAAVSEITAQTEYTAMTGGGTAGFGTGENANTYTDGIEDITAATEIKLDSTKKFYEYKVTIVNNDAQHPLYVVAAWEQEESDQFNVTFGNTVTNGKRVEIAASGNLVITCTLEIEDLAGNKIATEALNNAMALTVDLFTANDPLFNTTTPAA